MGIVWESAYHKEVPLLGVPKKPTDFGMQIFIGQKKKSIQNRNAVTPYFPIPHLRDWSDHTPIKL